MNLSRTAASFLASSLPITGKWWIPYLAVPYRREGRDVTGWDCFGAVRYILAAHASVRLPLFDTASAAEIMRQSKRQIWQRQRRPKQFDVVCMESPTRDGRRAIHVGIMVDDSRMLHCSESFGTVCVPLNHPTMNPIDGIYRHRALT